VGPPLGDIVLSIREIKQGVKVSVGPQDDVAAFATVAAVGPSMGDESLSSEAHAAPAAIAGFNVDFPLVNKHRFRRASGARSD
jgi:hypothetical protein